ncbi:MAG: hypothetical protein NZ839_00065, partial [Endomicrobia bacterium]|nr:hypothetical protein [Endomicrobiia bacterium]
ITEDSAVEVLYNNPYVNEIIPLSKAFLLYNQKFDIMINLDLDSIALRLTKNIIAQDRYGFYLNQNGEIVCSNDAAMEWFDLSHNDKLKKRNTKTYQQYLMEILGFVNLKPEDYPIIIKLTEEEKQFAKSFLKSILSEKEFQRMKFVGINLGGGDKWQKKEYPIKQTVQLIKYIATGKEIFTENLKILLFGGTKEKERNKKIISLISTLPQKYRLKIIDTGCNNTLREFFSLINLCDVVITSDSLALHVALGLNKKVIALFGPTSPNEIEMYGLGIKIVSPKKCVVCYKQKCNKVNDCMTSIHPKKIYQKLEVILH